MNIFYLDPDPQLCAMYHNDKHCIKMILEYAQLLSTAHRVIDGTLSSGLSETGRKQKRYVLPDSREYILYVATHINHPSAVWVRQSSANYTWLYNLFCALCDEYNYRYGKIHMTDMKMRHVLSHVPKNIPQGPFTEPTPAMPDDVKIAGNSLKSYHNYYYHNKKHLWSWKGKINSRERPTWLGDMILDNLHKINDELGLEY